MHLNKLNVSFNPELVCSKIPFDNGDYSSDLFGFYDKDGYNLNQYEVKLYEANGYIANKFIDDRYILGKTWMTIDYHPNLEIDHCIILERCAIGGPLRSYMQSLSHTYRHFKYLLQSKSKWGVDVDINWVDNDRIYEVIHLEYDTYNYEEALATKGYLENYFTGADLEDMARKIIANERFWSVLHGYDQNRWKAKFFGFEFSEDTRKSI